MVEQEVSWDSRFPRALSLHMCSPGHPWGWLHGAERQELHLGWSHPPDWGGPWSRASRWRWHGHVSAWEVCRHPQVTVAMCHWVPQCGCMCFELPSRCVSSQKHQPSHLCAQ